MNRLINTGLRRLGAATGGTLVALAAVFAVASPAQAESPDCLYAAGHYEAAGSYITAYNYLSCEGDVPLHLSIQRYLSPGIWETVASGRGETTYYCGGSDYNDYRTTGSAQFSIRCS